MGQNNDTPNPSSPAFAELLRNWTRLDEALTVINGVSDLLAALTTCEVMIEPGALASASDALRAAHDAAALNLKPLNPNSFRIVGEACQ